MSRLSLTSPDDESNFAYQRQKKSGFHNDWPRFATGQPAICSNAYSSNMSYSRGVHLMNPELEKNSGEFRTGRRHFSANKNQSSVFQYEAPTQWPRADRPLNLTPQQDYGQGYAARSDQSAHADEATNLREAIRQRDEELRQLQEQSPYAQSSAYTPPLRQEPMPVHEVAPLSKNPNLMEFERVKRDDVSGTQQRRRTAEALAYQRSEQLRVKDMERQARESEALERMASMRQMQEEEEQKKLDQRQRASDYRRMLDLQTQAKAKLQAEQPAQRVLPRRTIPAYPENVKKPAYMPSAILDNPLADYTNQMEEDPSTSSYAQNEAAFYGEEKGYGRPDSYQMALPPQPGRRQARNYHDTRQLIG